jgi:hypothetical protein
MPAPSRLVAAPCAPCARAPDRSRSDSRRQCASSSPGTGRRHRRSGSARGKGPSCRGRAQCSRPPCRVRSASPRRGRALRGTASRPDDCACRARGTACTARPPGDATCKSRSGCPTGGAGRSSACGRPSRTACPCRACAVESDRQDLCRLSTATRSLEAVHTALRGDVSEE